MVFDRLCRNSVGVNLCDTFPHPLNHSCLRCDDDSFSTSEM
jgi:hypothetical protein